MPILLMNGAGGPREVPLFEGETKLGRAESNHVVIESRRVSRFHAVLVRQGQFVTLRDLQSTNGTLVNGASVAACSLLDGDTLQLGDVEMQFFDDKDQASELGQRPLLVMAGAPEAGRTDGSLTEPARLDALPAARTPGRASAGKPMGGTRGLTWVGDAVAFTFAVEGRQVAALITYEALADHFGAQVHTPDADHRAVEAYHKNQVAINVAASLRYDADPHEPILLRTIHF